MRGKAAGAISDGPSEIIPTPRLVPAEASSCGAAMLEQIVEVDWLVCPACHGALRIVAFTSQAPVIDQILTHLRTSAAHAAR